MQPDSRKSDSELLAAIMVGDQDALGVLMQRYRRPLWRVARSRLGRDDWAEDAVQETFLNVVRWLSTYDSRYSFRTWLWTILLNQCHRQFRKTSRELLVSSVENLSGNNEIAGEIAQGLQTSDTPMQRLAAQERTQLLDNLLRQLPENQADAIRLRFFAELKYSEIAETMKCSLGTAKNRVKCGLMKLAEFLGPSGEYARWTVALGDFSNEKDD